MYFTWYPDSPVGMLLLAGTSEQLTHLLFADKSQKRSAIVPEPAWEENPRPFAEAVRQLKAYFAGKLQTFSLPVAGRGTEFQRAVWKELQNVPYGQTASYGEIAAAIGRPTASRAVGMANGRNPISIVVPCHRIIGSNGRLVGYGGGLHRKTRLLQLEGISVST